MQRRFSASFWYRALCGRCVLCGFRVGDQEIGLDPNGHKQGMTGYYHVDDIKKSLQSLLDSGAQVQQEVKDVGGGDWLRL